MLMAFGLMLFSGSLLGVFGWLRLRHARERLQREFDARLRSRTNLVRAAAHELRQPLNGIVGLVSSVRTSAAMGGAIDEGVDRRLDLSIREVNEALVNTLDIFDLSSGKIELEPEPMDIRTETKLLVRRINKHLSAERSRVKVITGHMPELWAEVDPLRLRQCLDTLINQAIAQTDEGVVRVSYRPEKIDGAVHKITFVIKDQGRGMDQHRAKRFFDPDEYDQNPALKDRPSAMLAINLAAQIAELMDGGITARSTLGNGTSFFLTVRAETCPPLDIAAEDVSTEPETVIVHDNFEKLSVLLVDDNEVNLFVLQEFIMPLDFGRVVCVSGGQEAIDRAAREPFDLILMDLAMPGVDGFAASSAIRQSGACVDTPIIAVSAEHLRASDSRLLEAGIDGYVAKPVVIADLFAAIQRVSPQMMDKAKSRGASVSDLAASRLRLAI